MLQMKLKELKRMASLGLAKDVTHATELPEKCETVGVSFGKYGWNGKLMRGLDTNGFYVVIGHVSNLYKF